MVLRKLKILSVGVTVSSEDAAVVYEAMDLRLKELHAHGILWFNVSGATSDISIVSGTATVNAASDVLFPVSLKLRVDDDDVDVRIIGHREYQNIGTKLETGEPEVMFFSGGVYRFWPVPDANYTGKLTYEQVADDTAASTRPDVSVSMLRAFSVIVAYDLADTFDTPEVTINRLEREAAEAMRTIRALNAERADPGVTEAEYF
jgi:hypothetical protein